MRMHSTHAHQPSLQYSTQAPSNSTWLLLHLAPARVPTCNVTAAFAPKLRAYSRLRSVLARHCCASRAATAADVSSRIFKATAHGATHRQISVLSNCVDTNMLIRDQARMTSPQGAKPRHSYAPTGATTCSLSFHQAEHTHPLELRRLNHQRQAVHCTSFPCPLPLSDC